MWYCDSLQAEAYAFSHNTHAVQPNIVQNCSNWFYILVGIPKFPKTPNMSGWICVKCVWNENHVKNIYILQSGAAVE